MSETHPHDDSEGPPPVPSQGAKDDLDVPKTFGQDQGVQDVRLVGQPAGWAAMANNMKEFDAEKVANVKDDIDSLLVFAGLFSAVLTAFVVESYQRLLPDTASAILATSSQSLAVMQQISLQMSNSSVRPLDIDTNPTTPPFQPSLDDIRTNALWFSSLIFSLITASFAILVKQWLREYTIFKNASPQARLRVRHYRYLALQRWQVFAIAAALPLFQQIALGLFFTGLCIFTISINKTVSITSITLVAAWAFLFVATTFLPIFIPRCPYKTTLLNPIFTATHFYAIRASVELASWWFKKGLPTLAKLVMWWRKEDLRGDLRHRFKNYCDKLGRFVDNYTLTNDEAKIAQQDTADLVILGDADDLRSNDDLLGTTIFDSLKQIHEPPWKDIVEFVSRLLDHRLPPTKDPRTDSSESSPQHRSLRTLSRSAYEGVMDILSHFLPSHIMESPNSDSSHQGPTQHALLLFFSESRYPLPAAGIELLRLHGHEIPKSMLTSLLETETQTNSLLNVIDQVVKLDSEQGFLLRENVWDATVARCLQHPDPLPLDRFLRAFDLKLRDDYLMSSLSRYCLQSDKTFAFQFCVAIEAIIATEYDDGRRHGMIATLARSCLQSAQPRKSIQSVIEAIDESWTDYDTPIRGKMIAALTHGCLQLEVIGPTTSLGYLIAAIDGRSYEENDRHTTLIALTHGCLQATGSGTSLRHLIAAIDSREYEENERHTTFIALTHGCLQATGPGTSLGHLIAAIDSRAYEENDRYTTLIALTYGCLQGTAPDISLGHLIEAIDDRAYEESDRYTTLIALTHGCLQLEVIRPSISLLYLIAAIDSRPYNENDRCATVVAITQGCLLFKDPAGSIYSLIAAVNAAYTTHDNLEPKDLRFHQDVRSRESFKFPDALCIFICVCFQSKSTVLGPTTGARFELHHLPNCSGEHEPWDDVSDDVSAYFGLHLKPVETALSLKYLLKAAASDELKGAISESRSTRYRCWREHCLPSVTRSAMFRIGYGGNPFKEGFFEVVEIIASIFFEEFGTSRGSPTFTFEADLTAFRWDKDIWSSSFAKQFADITMVLFALSTPDPGRSDVPEDESTPDPRLTGVLACMLCLAPSVESFELKSAIEPCLSWKKYTIVLLEALGRVSGEVVLNACTKLKLYSYDTSHLNNFISSLSTIPRPDTSIQESTQVTSTSKREHPSLTVLYALKITCFPTRFVCGYGEAVVRSMRELFESIIRLIYDSVDITSLLGTTGQADDSVPVVQLTLAIQRSSQLRELDALAILAKCCLTGVRYYHGDGINGLPCYKQLKKILATIYIASSPLDKDLREDQELLGLANLVEEVRNAMTVAEQSEQPSSATAGPHAAEEIEINPLDAPPEHAHDAMDNPIVVPTTETSDVAEGSSPSPPNLDLEEPRPTSSSASVALEAQEPTSALASTG